MTRREVIVVWVHRDADGDWECPEDHRSFSTLGWLIEHMERAHGLQVHNAGFEPRP